MHFRNNNFFFHNLNYPQNKHHDIIQLHTHIEVLSLDIIRIRDVKGQKMKNDIVGAYVL